MTKRATLHQALAFCLLCGCRHKTEKTDGDTLTIGFLPTIDILPYLVAEEMGIYDTLGLDLRLVELETTLQRDTLYAQQAIHGALLSTAEMLQHNAEGGRMVPTLTHPGLLVLVATNDSLIQKPADMKYSCIAVARASVGAYFGERVRNRWKFDEDDVAFPSIMNDTLRSRMVRGGQVEGAVLPYRFLTASLQDSVRLLARSDDFRAPLAVTAFPDTTLVQRKEEIQKLIVGYNRAVSYMNEADIAQWLPQSMAALFPVDSLELLPKFVPSQVLAPNYAAELLRWMAENDMVSQKMVSSYKPNTTVVEIYRLLK